MEVPMASDYIGMVYWTNDHRWAWQYVGGYYRLYDSEGKYFREFKSFEKMDTFIVNSY